MTKVQLTLSVEDADADEGHSTGLTEGACERLVDALADAGFEVTEGPKVQR